MHYTLFIPIAQITINHWASLFSIIGVIIAILMAAYSIYNSSKKEDSDTFARKDIVNKDIELLNNRITDNEKLNDIKFCHFKELLEEIKTTNEDMSSKIDILIRKIS